jgi:hypothetical protein
MCEGRDTRWYYTHTVLSRPRHNHVVDGKQLKQVNYFFVFQLKARLFPFAAG